MTELPLDIWRLVASYIPPSLLFTLVSVNRPLFNIVLDKRYGSIQLFKLDRTTAKYLVRLQDPDIASHVRRLHIRAWFLQYLFRREKLFDETAHDARSDGWPEWISRLFKTPRTPAVVNLALVNRIGEFASSKATLQAMETAISYMVNVTQYKLEWGDLILDQSTERLLLATQRAFDNSLAKLVLHARVSQLEHLLSIVAFGHLEELEFHFDFDPAGLREDSLTIREKNETTFVTSVAPFINSLSASLRSLVISSSAEGDHTLFLRALRPLPNLQTLILRISFHKDFLSDPTAISEILHRQKSSLSNVELRPNRPEPVKGVELCRQPRESRSAWSLIAKQCLSNTQWLRALDSLTLPALDHATTLALIRCTPSSLRNLCLLERFLEVDEVAEVIGALGDRPGLRSLSLELMRLTPKLLTLLANTLTGLHSLTLILGIDWHIVEKEEWKTMARQPLPEWSLYNLSIFIGAQRDDSLVVIPYTRSEECFMQALSKHVLPGVRSFKGRGHT